MYIGDPKEAKQMAEETKRKWEERAASNEPYPCRKCGVAKHPSEFVIQRLKNEWVGPYRYLYECKECKKERIYGQRMTSRETIEGAVGIIYKHLLQGANKRSIPFLITEKDIIDLRNKQDGKCYYTGYKMKYGFIHYKTGNLSEKTKMQVSCDRLDPHRGYEQGNVVLCCTLVNKMKNVLDEEEFYAICRDIIKHTKI